MMAESGRDEELLYVQGNRLACSCAVPFTSRYWEVVERSTESTSIAIIQCDGSNNTFFQCYTYQCQRMA